MVTLVEDKNGTEGVILPDTLRLCRNGEVMVKFDGRIGETALQPTELQEKREFFPQPDEKCRQCIFYTGQDCLAYSAGRFGMLFSNGNGDKKIPKRIYPYCKEEIGGE